MLPELPEQALPLCRLQKLLAERLKKGYEPPQSDAAVYAKYASAAPRGSTVQLHPNTMYASSAPQPPQQHHASTVQLQPNPMYVGGGSGGVALNHYNVGTPRQNAAATSTVPVNEANSICDAGTPIRKMVATAGNNMYDAGFPGKKKKGLSSSTAGRIVI